MPLDKLFLNMRYQFHAYGHPNILGTHKTTLEFTKDDNLSLSGNCIIGVNADFDLSKIKALIGKSKDKSIVITIKAIAHNNKKIEESISAEFNPKFNSYKEIVIRKTDFISERTFATKSDKSSFGLSRTLIDFLKKKANKISVTIQS